MYLNCTYIRQQILIEIISDRNIIVKERAFLLPIRLAPARGDKAGFIYSKFVEKHSQTICLNLIYLDKQLRIRIKNKRIS